MTALRGEVVSVGFNSACMGESPGKLWKHGCPGFYPSPIKSVQEACGFSDCQALPQLPQVTDPDTQPERERAIASLLIFK